ncbi:mechanosensitive ion channel protein MscS [Ruminococcus albus SY3]|uniref:Mechanosensitive ion channel protein MscS n=1 Tax=Ruminococcus albus SY3 TaxID=1341156 RepID=A0A011V2R7_RUMAL|nr:mechanosensitive ion channel family protein [Ruminococcus albus]EXM39737.1 mechanosensitive ion channel protein MscS [Ruminococcus albus SY3]
MLDRFLIRLEDMLPNMLAAVIILAGGYIAQVITLRLMGKALKLKHVDATVHKFLMSMVKVIITIIVVVSALSAMKVPMSSILAAIGTAGIAIGLALQDSLSNVAGGFIILFAKPFRCGDYVKIGENEGTVDIISILYTKLNTIENKAVYIPNSIASKSAVTNCTSEKNRCIELKFPISYSEDHKKVIEIIRGVLQAEDRVLSAPAKPLVVIGEHGTHAVIILTRSWVRTEDYWQTRWDILQKVKEAFDENGIVIPFEQLDIHMKDK